MTINHKIVSLLPGYRHHVPPLPSARGSKHRHCSRGNEITWDREGGWKQSKDCFLCYIHWNRIKSGN